MSKKNPIIIEINKKIIVEPSGIFEGKVIVSGNGAVISFFKRFIGKEVIILVKDKIKIQKKDKSSKEKFKDVMETTGELIQSEK